MSSINLRQTLGVEPVRGIEEFEVRLIKVSDCDGLKLKTVLRQRLLGRGFDASDIIAALLVHLLHCHLGGDRAQRGDELARQQGVKSLRLERAPPERCRRDRHRLAGRLYANIEVGLDIDAHAIAGDEGAALLAHDLHRQHVHIDGGEVVDERQDESAAVDHHPLAEKAGAHERHLARRAMVEPVDHVHDDHDDNDRDDQPEDQSSDQEPRHFPIPPLRTTLPRAARNIIADR